MSAITGAHATRFGHHEDTANMVQEAAQGALNDAGLTREDIDALVVANAAAEHFTPIGNVSVWTATQTGLTGTPTLRIDTGPSSGLASIWAAHALAQQPHIEHVLCLGWETMTTLPTPEATQALARLMAQNEQRHHLTLPGLVGLLASAYLDRYAIDPIVLDHAAVKAHRLAANNPIAQFQDPITIQEAQRSPIIADPLRLYHCAPLTDGAAAITIGSEGPVTIEAMGQATDHLGFTQRRSAPESFLATRKAARRAFERSRHEPRDMDVIELHDAFTILEAVNLEDLGLVPEGEGPMLIPGPDEAPLSPEVAVNPSGGLKARGHPIGATGLAQVIEVVDQIQGKAATQVPQARVGLVHNIGGFGNNVHVALLEASA